MTNTGTVSIEYPDELRVSLKYKRDEFADEIKKISLIKLYELGKISSGIESKKSPCWFHQNQYFYRLLKR
jgi:methyl coenzyme M reductase subunit C-like uncharacterized protein (methanogenesis marker protein 7)